jgi:hypothetical protein
MIPSSHHRIPQSNVKKPPGIKTRTQVRTSVEAKKVNFAPQSNPSSQTLKPLGEEMVSAKPDAHSVPTTAGSASERLLLEAVRKEYGYARLGIFLGLASIIGGCVLSLNGVAGSTSWTAKLLGLENQINDAAPGVVLFIVGIFLVLITKPKVKMEDLQG